MELLKKCVATDIIFLDTYITLLRFPHLKRKEKEEMSYCMFLQIIEITENIILAKKNIPPHFEI